MACGDKFAAEVVTVDGYTPENPFGKFAVPGDYTGWHQLAQRMMDRLESRWREEGELEPSPFTWWNGQVDEMNALRRRVAELPPTWRAGLTGAGITGAIDDASRLIADINCQREVVEDRIGELGGKLASLPGAGSPKPASDNDHPLGIHWGWWIAGGVAAIGGAVGGGYALAAKRRRR